LAPCFVFERKINGILMLTLIVLGRDEGEGAKGERMGRDKAKLSSDGFGIGRCSVFALGLFVCAERRLGGRRGPRWAMG